MKTPQQSYPELAHALGVDSEVYLKREDLHPYGSHKGRSIPLMIKTHAKEGQRHFVISSSGNAALAAIHTVVQHNKNNPGKEIRLTIFIGKKIDEEKLKTLAAHMSGSPSLVIEQVDNPKQQAFQMDAEGGAISLRQSTDDLALEGYAQLAEELAKIEHLAAVFIPTSSGTTAQALGKAFWSRGLPIEIHIVQTTACHPMAEVFDSAPHKTDMSMASAIVDHVAHRKDAVVDIIKKSNGAGWIVTDEEIATAMKLTKQQTGLDISPNSALALAGLAKAVKQAKKWPGPVACLITGA